MKREAFLGTLAGKLLALLTCLWLLTMLLLTLALAGDLQRQAERALAPLLEESLEELRESYDPSAAGKPEETLLLLPEPHFFPARTLPLLREKELRVWSGSLTLNRLGVAVASCGFDAGSIVPLGSVGVTPNTGITVTEGMLAFRVSSALLEGTEPSDFYGGLTPTYKRYGGAPTSGFLTFRLSPLRKGSFPSLEISGSWPEEPVYDPTKPLTPGNQTPPGLLEGIDSGEYHFDSRRLLQGSLLRGGWLRDGEGNPRCFVLAAYGWDPVPAAVSMLPGVYLASLLLFLLAGALLWLTLRRTLVRPLRELGEKLAADPLAVTEQEYDFLFRWEEVQDVLAPYLLRRQMEAALPAAGAALPEALPRLGEALENAQGKLLPILMDRGQEIHRDLAADGEVCASASALEDALLALFRDALPYAEQNRRMELRTLKTGGCLLTEVGVRTKRGLKRPEFRRLWDGIYREPDDGDAPGAKLRKATAAIPGAFAAVRRTEHGLALTLGLPTGSEELGAGSQE